MDPSPIEPLQFTRPLSMALRSLCSTERLEEGGVLQADIRRKVSSGELHRVRRSMYVGAEAFQALQPWEQRVVDLYAHSAAASSPPTFCFTSAARLWGFDLWRAGSAIHVLQRRGKTRTVRGADIVGHVWDIAGTDIHHVKGLRATSAARTALDCARFLPWRPGVVVLDSALRMGLRRGDLQQALAQGGPRRGTRRASIALAFADGQSESVAESRLRLLLHGWNVPAPTLQHPVITPAGRFRADFAWPDFGLVIEVHGDGKYFMDKPTDQKLLEERKREAAFAEAGIRILNVWWPQLDDPALRDRVLRHLAPVLRRAG